MNNKELWDIFSKVKAASYNRVIVEMIYVDIAEDFNAGVLLSQILYWYLPDNKGKMKLRVFKHGDYWLAKSYVNWYEEIRLNKKQIMRASKILEKKKLLKTKVYKFNGAPTVHYKLNIDKFTQLLQSELEKSYKIPDSAESALSIVPKVYNPLCNNGTIESAESALSLTETTTETTNIDHNREREAFVKFIDKSSKSKNQNSSFSLSDCNLFEWVSQQFKDKADVQMKMTKSFQLKWSEITENIPSEAIKSAVNNFLQDKWRMGRPAARKPSILFKDVNNVFEWAAKKEKSKANENKFLNKFDISDLSEKAKKWLNKLSFHYSDNDNGYIYLTAPKNTPRELLESELLKTGSKFKIFLKS